MGERFSDEIATQSAKRDALQNELSALQDLETSAIPPDADDIAAWHRWTTAKLRVADKEAQLAQAEKDLNAPIRGAIYREDDLRSRRRQLRA